MQQARSDMVVDCSEDMFLAIGKAYRGVSETERVSCSVLARPRG